MKIAEKYTEHEEIFKAGYVFDPEQSIFYTQTPPEPKKGEKVEKIEFKFPEGYEDWTVEEIDFYEYGKKRLEECGINDKNNTIELRGTPNDPKSKDVLKEEIFTVNPLGNIEILQFSLDGKPHSKDKNKDEAVGKGTVKGKQYCYQERLHPIRSNISGGKYDYSNAKVVPFWPSQLVQNFSDKTEQDYLIITEGQFKAQKATIEEIPTCGLTSISHFRDQETKSLHPEIIQYLQACKVKKCFILWDGDCANISSTDLKERNDLTQRPNSFYGYAKTIRTELKKYIKTKGFEIFFVTINSYKIEGAPKGIDDLLIDHKYLTEKIKEEISMIGNTPTVYLHWQNITTDQGVKEMRSFFGFEAVNKFYQKHADLIKEKPFVFFGSDYKIEKGVPVLEVSKDVKAYKKIGTDFYQIIPTPVPNGKKDETVVEERLIPWTKQSIVDDHGAKVIQQIERYKGFTNVANHIDYQPVVHNHWNLYYNVNHEMKKGEFPTINKFLLHLFEEHFENEMIYDYFTLLFTKPMQKLPVVCLVSKLQETGKSTFIYLLKLIFKQNLTIISSSELSGDFDSHWKASLIVASEETILEKKEGYEKIKSYSTAFETSRNEKNKTSQPIPCMIHFVFCSNHEDDFIKIDDYDSRLWIRKIQARKETIPNFDMLLEQEVPYFVDFIANREVKYQSKGDRLFFAAKDFETGAKKLVIQNSEPGIIKDLRIAIGDYFMRFEHEKVLKMHPKNIRQYFGIRGEPSYLNREIKKYLNPEKSANATAYHFLIPDTGDEESSVKVRDKERHFIFKREKFINQ